MKIEGFEEFLVFRNWLESIGVSLSVLELLEQAYKRGDEIRYSIGPSDSEQNQ
jgi:hypothetical protein